MPRIEDLPAGDGEGVDRDAVREAFETYRRHVAQLQAQLRVVQAAGTQAEPTGHSVRMDALHLIRGAAEFADMLERDAQRASAAQLARTEEEVRGRQNELQRRAAELDAYRQESERQRAELLNAAKREARGLVNTANTESTRELQEAETKGARLLEQSRHQAMELTNAARAEVEQTLEWARAQAGVVLARAQEGAEQLLRAAGLGDEALAGVTRSIVEASEAAVAASRQSTQRPTDTVPVDTFERLGPDEPDAVLELAAAPAAEVEPEPPEPQPEPPPAALLEPEPDPADAGDANPETEERGADDDEPRS